MELHVEPGAQNPPIQCACCGMWTLHVQGHVLEGEATLAAYSVHWTAGNLSHPPIFDLIIGSWGEGTGAEQRLGVSLKYRAGQGFMVIDSDDRPFSKGTPLFSHPLKRSEVIGTEMAAVVFKIVDAIWLQDGRLLELRSGTTDRY